MSEIESATAPKWSVGGHGVEDQPKHKKSFVGRGKGVSNGATKRFISGVALEFSSDECLNWPFSTLPSGYGKLFHSGRYTLAHRVVCELAHGPPFHRAEAAHSCGNNRCVNPSHLRWASHIDNEKDKRAHGTLNAGERNGFSKLTAIEVAEIRSAHKSIRRKELAAQFGVSVSNIGLIVNKKTWRGVL